MNAALSLMRWSEPFVTGLPLVDQQHHALVDLVNQAASHLAVNDSAAQRAMGALLDQLTRYAAVHFRDEEALMHSAGLDPRHIAHHHASHQDFVAELGRMRARHDAQGQLAGGDVLSFLANWLNFHILLEDQQMAAEMRLLDQGLTPEQAWARCQQPENGAQAVVQRSLVELFTLLSRHNRELGTLKLALEQANQGLEARVAERTRALADSVQHLQQTQRQLVQSEKMAAVGQLAAGVAHEINNPVGFVMSNLSTLEGNLGQLTRALDAHRLAAAFLPEAQRAALSEIDRSADLDYLRQDLPALLRETREGLERVKRIVTDLREFSHVDDAPAQTVDLNSVAQRALSLAANALKYKAQVQTELAAQLPVTGQPGQITQVVLNLLVNAAQAMGEHGHIRLRSGDDAQGSWLQVQDDGCGMSEAVRSRIFEPFFTTKPVGTGTGLGLSVSWEIVQRHQGRLSVDSQPGAGSTFSLWLPRAASPAQ